MLIPKLYSVLHVGTREVLYVPTRMLRTKPSYKINGHLLIAQEYHNEMMWHFSWIHHNKSCFTGTMESISFKKLCKGDSPTSATCLPSWS